MALNRAPSGGRDPNNRERDPRESARQVLLAALQSSSGRERIADNAPTPAERHAADLLGIGDLSIEAIEESLR